MDFQEKIRRLVGTRNKSALSKEAGLPATALDAVINKGREPLASNAVRLARVLGAPCEWLFDDAQGWQPPGNIGEESLRSASELQLIERLGAYSRLMIRTLRVAAEGLPLDRLLRLESLAALEHLGPDQQRDLDAGVRDILLHYGICMNIDSLSWLVHDTICRTLSGVSTGDIFVETVDDGAIRDASFPNLVRLCKSRTTLAQPRSEESRPHEVRIAEPDAVKLPSLLARQRILLQDGTATIISNSAGINGANEGRPSAEGSNPPPVERAHSLGRRRLKE